MISSPLLAMAVAAALREFVLPRKLGFVLGPDAMIRIAFDQSDGSCRLVDREDHDAVVAAVRPEDELPVRMDEDLGEALEKSGANAAFINTPSQLHYEQSKAAKRRFDDGAFQSRYFVGRGIDIGGGPDPLGIPSRRCKYGIIVQVR